MLVLLGAVRLCDRKRWSRYWIVAWVLKQTELFAQPS